MNLNGSTEQSAADKNLSSLRCFTAPEDAKQMTKTYARITQEERIFSD
jgi:hypothetical protein